VWTGRKLAEKYEPEGCKNRHHGCQRLEFCRLVLVLCFIKQTNRRKRVECGKGDRFVYTDNANVCKRNLRTVP